MGPAVTSTIDIRTFILSPPHPDTTTLLRTVDLTNAIKHPAIQPGSAVHVHTAHGR
jgi:hypothetical protein